MHEGIVAYSLVTKSNVFSHFVFGIVRCLLQLLRFLFSEVVIDYFIQTAIPVSYTSISFTFTYFVRFRLFLCVSFVDGSRVRA